MAIGLIGQKLGMTRVMSSDGSAVAVSVINIEPNNVVQVKTSEVDGYSAVQVTTGAKVNKKGEAKIRRISAALKGHYAKAGQKIGLGLWEFTEQREKLMNATKFTIDMFATGHYVDVVGRSKGKGFQGVIKRYNFSMQDATHGNSRSHRAIGATGQCQTPGRVFKGKKMAGHMGDETITQECLKIITVDSVRNLLLVKGSIPGAKKGFVKVILSNKKNKINEKINEKVSKKVVEIKEVKTVAPKN